MLIKPADDRTADLDALRDLASRPDATPEVRARIDQEVRNIQSGVRGESDAAYQIDFYFKDTKNWAIIHDLRVECGGRVAQIDHLLINRVLQMYVCESKSIREGVSVNDRGEFVTFFRGQARGIPSPIEQNQRHIAVLEALFKSGQVPLPRRLGFAITPAIFPLVLVSTRARITRPTGGQFESIIKADQLKSRVDADVDADNNALKLAKLLSPESLREFAERLAEEHRPIAVNWPAKFGLPPRVPIEASRSKPPTAPVAAVGATISIPADTSSSGEKKSKLICSSCGNAVAYNVAKFCWVNKPRFGGLVYCFDCQKNVPKNPPRAPE